MQAVYVDVVRGADSSLIAFQQTGGVSPMHCTGNGKLLLLNYTDAELDTYIREKGLKRIRTTLSPRGRDWSQSLKRSGKEAMPMMRKSVTSASAVRRFPCGTPPEESLPVSASAARRTA